MHDLALAGPAVVFMMKHLKLTGADVSSDDIVCAPCDFTRAGGFSPEAGAVVLCQGKFMNKRHMEDTIVHELVHMYDHAKFKVDWNNLRHHACSEVRITSFLWHIRQRSTPVTWQCILMSRLRPVDPREQPKRGLSVGPGGTARVRRVLEAAPGKSRRTIPTPRGPISRRFSRPARSACAAAPCCPSVPTRRAQTKRPRSAQ